MNLKMAKNRFTCQHLFNDKRSIVVLLRIIRVGENIVKGCFNLQLVCWIAFGQGLGFLGLVYVIEIKGKIFARVQYIVLGVYAHEQNTHWQNCRFLV